MRLKIYVTLLVSFVVGLLFFIFGSNIKNSLDSQIVDSTYQFFLLTVVGGGGTLFFDSYRQNLQADKDEAEVQRENRDRRREIQRSLRSDLIKAFNEIVKVKRLLTAEAIVGGTSQDGEFLIGEEYKKQINTLIDSQLSIEFAYRVIAGEDNLFQDEELVDSLKTINNYLRGIIDEFERSYRKFSEDCLVISLNEFPELSKFIHHSSEASRIGVEYWAPAGKALIIIGKSIQS